MMLVSLFRRWLRAPPLAAQVTTTDQETGAVGKEPLMTLGTFRSGKLLGWSALDSWKHEVGN